MQKQTVYRFSYNGDRIRCVRSVQEPPEKFWACNAHWLVIVLGVLAAYGWWMLWA